MTRCAECGYDWAGPDEQAVAAIDVLPHRLDRLVLDLNVDDRDGRVRYRPAPDAWSPLEYMAHTTDSLAWYADRIERVMREDRPALDGFDWDAHTRDQRYHDRRLGDVLTVVDHECCRLVTTLTIADSLREGYGSDAQPRSITQLAHRAAHEAKHHLRDIALGLIGTPRPPGAEKRTLLVSDLDGTLLRADGTVGTRTIEVINDFIEQGGMFTYATARAFTTAARVTNGLNVRLPVITYGGAVVVDPLTNTSRPARTIGAATARAIIELTEHSPVLQPIMFATHCGRDRVCWIAHKPTHGVDGFLAKRVGDPRLMPLHNWSEIDLDKVFYISLIGRQDELAALRDRIPATGVHVMFSQDVYTAEDWWIEVSASNGTKAAALAELVREMEIDELVCFGDNYNDLPMFAIAHQAIAVKNATPAALAAATHVINSNDDEGVAHWIQKLLHRAVPLESPTRSSPP